ncbi:ARI5A protein, partial [Heliornis fulica]|nr:ARI5A protein [Heliornis fulica]
MSPLAKKKLLAQVSKAESLHYHKRHCPEGWGTTSDAGPGHESPWPAAGHEQRSPEPSRTRDTDPGAGNEVGPTASVSPSGSDSQPCPRADEGGPAPAVFTGCFHAYRSDVLKPVSCHQLWGYFSSLKESSEPPSTFPPRSEEPAQPQDLRCKARQPWTGENRQGATGGAAVKACWVPPRASFTPAEPRGRRGREEDSYGPSAKLRAVSPFAAEADGQDTGAGSPRGLAKPKAVVAGPGYAATLPHGPDVYKGVMLHFPASFGNPLEHLKTQGVPAAPSLSVNPFVIPAFPSPLVATSTQPSDLCRPLATGPGHYPVSYERSLRQQLYPAVTWQSHPPYAAQAAFHRHAKL